jgi:hypothetical protein
MPRTIQQYPHCDASVLHAPGICEYCDGHPDWQELRETWGIAFTGKPEAGKLPDPASLKRPEETINMWHGNRAYKEETEPPVPPVDRSAVTTLHGTPVADVRRLDPEEGMQRDYIVLTEEERKKGFVRPVRDTYRHESCGSTTTMGRALAETYARDPTFYGATMCVRCNTHLPVGPNGEFEWMDGTKVGS